MVLQKANEFRTEASSRQVFNFNDIAAEAQAILESARRDARKIKEQADKEVEKIRGQAHGEGHDEGFAAGKAKGDKEGREQALKEQTEEFARLSKDTLAALCAALEQFGQLKHRALWQAEQDMVSLVVAIARKVVKKAALISSEVAQENVKAALELVTQPTDVVIILNPQDLEHLERTAGKREQVLGNYSNIRFETSETIGPGGCQVRTENGEIEADLDSQVSRIAKELVFTSSDNT